MRASVFNLLAVTAFLLAAILAYLYLTAREKKVARKDILHMEFSPRFAVLAAVITACAIGMYFYGIGKAGHGGMEAFKNAVAFFWMAMIAWIDAKEKIIPNKLIVAALAVWVVLFLIEVLFARTPILQLLSFSGIGGGVCAGAMLIISLIVKDALGMGDIKMLFVLGLLFGLLNAFAIILLAMIIMSITALILLLLKKATKKTAIPMAPFVFFGLALNLLAGM